MDLYSSDVNGYSSIGMRDSKKESMLSAVNAHNANVANEVLIAQGQAKESIAGKLQAQGMATTNLVGSLDKRMDDYTAWVKNGKQTKLPSNPLKAIQDKYTANKEANFSPESAGQKPPEVRAEGTPAAFSGALDDSHVVTNGAKDASEAGSMVSDGLKAGSGIVGSMVKGVSVLGDIAQGGDDLYTDIKSGKIAGNNGWEKAGNVLQIGSGIADTVGLVFPPAEVIGGILGVIGGVVNSIGEEKESSGSDAKVKKQVLSQAPADNVSGGATAGVVATARPTG
tara:strand:+ start:102 stop:947 length:846 start_codon:yes stop_codon:yes gene_type:complete